MIRAEDKRKQTEPGALVLPRMGADGGYLFQCCDCALVHRLDFTITEKHGLEMRGYVDEAECAGMGRAPGIDERSSN
jgi:hypothetical protein